MAGRTIDKPRLQAFLQRLSDSLNRPGVIFLLGGSALTWLGVKNESIDVDVAFAEDETDPDALRDAVAVAGDFIEAAVDVIRVADLLPLPEGSAERATLLGEFGGLRVYSIDPYTIALTKLARSAEKDIQDVGGMIQRGLIDCAMLQTHFESVLARHQRRVSRADWEDFKRKVESFDQQYCE